ncbi:hypothetical protein BCV70DRAFT_216568 [Testicularia cyperi]|uniref:Uncharacterized protein n=1 Tax=Testicularia cyperi TaxID=1882483 RepID=A0A317XPR7_9BASI|nr:hypothetical protein BCV70DRAFT_216568 [Testicularia cyperi]
MQLQATEPSAQEDGLAMNSGDSAHVGVGSSSSPHASYTTCPASSQAILPSYSESRGITRTSQLVAGSADATDTTSYASDDFFDIAPRSDSTSFQVGYLGLKGFQAWIKGDVLVKLDSLTKARGTYVRCTVQLDARERASSPSEATSRALVNNTTTASSSCSGTAGAIELFSHTLTLWDATQQPTSSSAASPHLPSSMPFSFPLTSDLPHCVHLRDSSLTYRIIATLWSADTSQLPNAVKSIPIHLVRYTRPGPLDVVELAEIDGTQLPNHDFSLRPHTWIEQLPTLAYVQISRSIFRRAEPIDIRVRIPPPDPTSIAEKGLKLRSVEADLVRLIHVKRPGTQSSSSKLPEGSDPTFASDVTVHEALLAHSGKLCRFHSQRPVLLRLSLHPPFDRANMPHPHPDHDALVSGPVFGRGGGGGCESISQETLMHKVSFEVRIKIGIHGGRGERRDIVCRKAVKILPGAAGALEESQSGTSSGTASQSTEKEKLKRAEKMAASSVTADKASDTASSSAAADGMLDFGMEDEYDGYEDVGRGLDELINDPDGVDEPESSSSHAVRLEQLRQLLDNSDAQAAHGPPPTLLESQHDVQVEIEVEGVGLAMPRRDRHPADPFPLVDEGTVSYLEPPPHIDDTSGPPMSHPAAHYSLTRSADVSGFTTPDEPPPPISPLAHTDTSVMRSGESLSPPPLHMPGGFDFPSSDPSASSSACHEHGIAPHRSFRDGAYVHGPNLASAHPTYEAAVSESHGAVLRPGHGNEAAASNVGPILNGHEPPPYLDGSHMGQGHDEPIPSFDQAVQQDRAAPRVSTFGTAAAGSSLADSARIRLGSTSDASHLGRGYQRPPAYGTSPHPPSYDA